MGFVEFQPPDVELVSLAVGFFSKRKHQDSQSFGLPLHEISLDWSTI